MRPLLPKPPSAPAQPIVQMAQPAIDNAAQPPPKNRKRTNANTGPAAVKRAKPSSKPTENPREDTTQPPAKTRKRTNASTGPAAAKRAKPRAKPPKNPPDDPSTLLQADDQVPAGLQSRGFLEVPLNVPQTLRETMACMRRGEALRIGELLEDHAGELYVLAHDLDLKIWSAGMNSVMQVLEGSEDSGYCAGDDMGDEARVLVSHF
ncbi:hypothetical protein Tdes44962_MAKER07238 [Teratosphaeria destructans]|uniref:Uncharacterized protein n=1 Tax=Teratosphaeria destructans TaxID=418781 RepID=A0A9W7T069_9PEZI|nr:hypothetical protein Tdes44962_MAKER07238 [Teratosphaeria destructans]